MMKTILLLAVLIPLQVFAGLPPTALKGQSGSNVTTFNFQVPHSQATQVSGPTSLIETGNQNILQNPGFEGTGDWTASGGATTAINTTAVGTGSKGYDWDSNSASQTLSSDSVTIPNGLKGKNGVVSCAIKTVSGTATHTIQAYDGTNIVGSSTINSDTNSFARTALNFVFPSSGSIVLRLVSVASNEPEIYIDDCYMGLAEGFNIGSVSQASFYGSATWVGVSACVWTNTSNQSFANFTADTDCTSPTGSNLQGFASAPATKVPGITFSSLPPGRYIVLAKGSFGRGGATNSCSWRITDGTTPSSASRSLAIISEVQGEFNYTAPQSNVTFQIQATGASASTQCDLDNDVATTYNLRLSVYRYPTSEETAYRPEVQNVWGSTYWPDGTASFTTTSASYTAVTAASMLGTAVRTGRAVACADTNAICIEIPSMPAGSYKVEYSGGIIGDSGTSCAISVYDGTTDYEMSGTNGGGAISGHTVINYSSQQTDKEFTIRIKRTSGVNNCQVATSIALGHNITITPLSQNIPAPVLVGSVTSGATGAIRVEGASLAAPSGGACAVTEVGGSDWLNGNCTSSGTGICTCTLNSGVFSSAPICQISIANLAAANSRDEQITSTSTSTIVTFTATTGGIAVNNDVTIMCMGPR